MMPRSCCFSIPSPTPVAANKAFPSDQANLAIALTFKKLGDEQ